MTNLSAEVPFLATLLLQDNVLTGDRVFNQARRYFVIFFFTLILVALKSDNVCSRVCSRQFIREIVAVVIRPIQLVLVVHLNFDDDKLNFVKVYYLKLVPTILLAVFLHFYGKIKTYLKILFFQL